MAPHTARVQTARALTSGGGDEVLVGLDLGGAGAACGGMGRVSCPTYAWQTELGRGAGLRPLSARYERLPGWWSMATFSTSAEVLTPDHPLVKRGQSKGLPLAFVLADVLRQTGGAYQTTTPMTEKFRDCIRTVAMLTSDDGLLRIAELPEVPVSLENCRQLDPQTRFVIVCRLDVTPAETPRWRRIPPAGIPPWPRGEPRILDMCRGAHIEERTLSDGIRLLHMRPAADLSA